jgi:hypothetical protein
MLIEIIERSRNPTVLIRAIPRERREIVVLKIRSRRRNPTVLIRAIPRSTGGGRKPA